MIKVRKVRKKNVNKEIYSLLLLKFKSSKEFLTNKKDEKKTYHFKNKLCNKDLFSILLIDIIFNIRIKSKCYFNKNSNDIFYKVNGLNIGLIVTKKTNKKGIVRQIREKGEGKRDNKSVWFEL